MTLRNTLVAGIALCATLALLASVCVEPLDHGYLRYAAIAQTMLRTGDWIVPRHGGEIYVLKPPLFVWLTALPIWILGRVPEWASHLAPLLGGLCAAIATFRIAARMHGSRDAGLVSVLVLVTLPEFASEWRGERIDPLFAGCFALAMDAFHEALTPGRGVSSGPGASARAGFFVALAMLTKGPLALLLVALVLLPFLGWLRRANEDVGRLRLGIAGVVLALVLLPWPALFLSRLGWESALGRIEDSDFATRKAEPWIYLVSIPAMLGAWLGLLPALVIHLRNRPFRAIAFPILWFVVPFVALHLPPTRHIRYLAPLFPAVALLFTDLAMSVVQHEAVIRALRVGFRCVFALAGIAGVGAVIAVFVDRTGLARWLDGGMTVTPVVLVGVGISLVLLAQRGGRMVRRGRYWVTAVGAVSCTSRSVRQLSVIALLCYVAKDTVDAERYVLNYDRASMGAAFSELGSAQRIYCVGTDGHEVDLVVMLNDCEVIACPTVDEFSRQVSSTEVSPVVIPSKDVALLTRVPGIIVREFKEFTAWRDEHFTVAQVTRN